MRLGTTWRWLLQLVRHDGPPRPLLWSHPLPAGPLPSPGVLPHIARCTLLPVALLGSGMLVRPLSCHPTHVLCVGAVHWCRLMPFATRRHDPASVAQSRASDTPFPPSLPPAAPQALEGLREKISATDNAALRQFSAANIAHIIAHVDLGRLFLQAGERSASKLAPGRSCHDGSARGCRTRLQWTIGANATTRLRR